MTAPHVRPRRGFFSTIALIIDRFVELCTIVPYSLVALALRLVMARVFFLDGQSKIEGPSVLLQVADFSLPIVLPHGVRAETIQTFTSYSALPFAPNLAAAFVSYCEFFLPIFLVLGFATRFSALTLLVITIMIQYYVLPGALWTTPRLLGRDPPRADDLRRGSDLNRPDNPLFLRTLDPEIR